MFALFGSLIAAVLLVNISHILTGFWGSFLSTNSSEASTPRLSKQQKKMARQKRIKEEKERKKARREHVIHFVIVTTAANSGEIPILFYYLHSALRFLRLDKTYTVAVMPLSQVKVSNTGCECLDDEDPDISGEGSPHNWRMDRRLFRTVCDQGCDDYRNVEHGPLSPIMLSNLLPGLHSENIKYVIGIVPVKSVQMNPFPFSWTFFNAIWSLARTDAVHSTIITGRKHIPSKYIQTSLKDGKVIVAGQQVGMFSEEEKVLVRRLGYSTPSSSRYEMRIVQKDTFLSSLFNCHFDCKKMHEFLELMNHLTFTENDGEEADVTVFSNTIHYLPTPLIIMFEVLFLNEMHMFRTFADHLSVSLPRDFTIASAH